MNKLTAAERNIVGSDTHILSLDEETLKLWAETIERVVNETSTQESDTDESSVHFTSRVAYIDETRELSGEFVDRDGVSFQVTIFLDNSDKFASYEASLTDDFTLAMIRTSDHRVVGQYNITPMAHEGIQDIEEGLFYPLLENISRG